ESKQGENEKLAFPTGKQCLEHCDRSLAVRTFRSDAIIDRKRTAEREQYEEEGRDRRQVTGSHERDTRLITERREIVQAREAHYLPPAVLWIFVVGVLSGVASDALHQPLFES